MSAEILNIICYVPRSDYDARTRRLIGWLYEDPGERYRAIVSHTEATIGADLDAKASNVCEATADPGSSPGLEKPCFPSAASLMAAAKSGNGKRYMTHLEMCAVGSWIALIVGAAFAGVIAALFWPLPI